MINNDRLKEILKDKILKYQEDNNIIYETNKDIQPVLEEFNITLEEYHEIFLTRNTLSMLLAAKGKPSNMYQYSIRIDTRSYKYDNNNAPYFWAICQDGYNSEYYGWSKSIEEAWDAALDNYNRYIKPNIDIEDTNDTK